jgi:hypothetical protein
MSHDSFLEKFNLSNAAGTLKAEAKSGENFPSCLSLADIRIWVLQPAKLSDSDDVAMRSPSRATTATIPLFPYHPGIDGRLVLLIAVIYS